MLACRVSWKWGSGSSMMVSGLVDRLLAEGSVMTTQMILINGFGVLFVILNSFGLGLRLSVGKLLAEAFAHWKIAVWVLVINFVIIPLLFIGYLLTIASSIPDEIKVGFCVAALCAGMPFAPSCSVSEGGCQHCHHAVGGLDRRNDYRPPHRSPPRRRCG